MAGHARASDELPTVEVVRSLLRLDADTGRLFWLVDRGLGAKAGDEAGYRRADGRVIMVVCRKHILRSRVVWAMVHGRWPDSAAVIDHRNLDKGDDRPSNLRVATWGQNQRNQPKARNNTSGYKGVSWARDRGKYHAYINVDRKRRTIGHFPTISEAAEAVAAQRLALHGQFARTE